MRDHDQRRAVFAAKFEQQIKHRIGRGAVEIAGGFIGKQAGRPGDQCARHGDALHATRCNMDTALPSPFRKYARIASPITLCHHSFFFEEGDCRRWFHRDS